MMRNNEEDSEKQWICFVRRTINEKLKMDMFTFGTLFLLITSLIGFVLNRLFGLKFAKLEEFESLTPLTVTPYSNIAPIRQSPKRSQIMVAKNVASTKTFTRSVIKKQEESPPPPRRSLGGQTMIVPLTGNNNRIVRQTLLSASLAQYENRYLTLDGGKSCETIPEDNEIEFGLYSNNPDSTNVTTDDGIYDDLLSIDRVCYFIPGANEILDICFNNKRSFYW